MGDKNVNLYIHVRCSLVERLLCSAILRIDWNNDVKTGFDCRPSETNMHDTLLSVTSVKFLLPVFVITTFIEQTVMKLSQNAPIQNSIRQKLQYSSEIIKIQIRITINEINLTN